MTTGQKMVPLRYLHHVCKSNWLRTILPKKQRIKWQLREMYLEIPDGERSISNTVPCFATFFLDGFAI